jgi:adenylate cyclase
MKILVAEDNRENLELIFDVLKIGKYEVIKTLDGISALEQTKTQSPDLIILDVSMPGMSGFEVLQALKSDEQLSLIPVIMLTAISDIDNRVKGINMGAEDYLSKPFSPKELLARVERALKAKQLRDETVQQREQVRLTFERFVDPKIVEQLLKDPLKLQLGGKTQIVTILFADLEGFTALAENHEPERVLQILNSYHALIVKILVKYGGIVDKFVGDCVMALFNTPNEQPDHIARAVKTALHIQDELHWFHQKLEPDYRLKINFGIHSGKAVVGTVGTDKHMNFTAIGDTVNIAARLQEMAKEGQILVTQEVYDDVQNFVVGHERGSMKVKGRSEAISVVQVSNSPIDE